MPETAVLGTVHDAETAQLPQSISPVDESVRHAGWVWGSVDRRLDVGLIDPRAVAAVVAEPEDVDVVLRRRRLDLELTRSDRR